MKSTAPLIATAAGIIAVIVGVFLFGDRFGLGEKPAEPTTPASKVTTTEAPEASQTPAGKQAIKEEVKKDGKENASTDPAKTDVGVDEQTSSGNDAAGTNEPDASSEASDPQAMVKKSESDTKPVEKSEKAGEAAVETSDQMQSKPAENPDVSASAKVKEDIASMSKGVAPSFDIVRVEPDGNTLVAGRASPNWMVELRNGAEVLAKTTADANGEWVIILEKALQLGVSDLSLAAMAAEGGDAMTSASSVTVARPEDGKGELLVVENIPGKPSKILAKIVDQTKKAAEAEMASGVEKTVPTDTTSKQDMAKVEETATKPATESENSSDVAKAEKPAEVMKEEPKESASEKPAVIGRVSIEAVEIEGNTLFVAGAAEPAGSLLRMYVNNKAISDTRSGETGRFLFDGDLVLEPGRHALRVDLLDSSNGAVVNRAEVAFVKQAPALKEQPAKTEREATITSSGETSSGNDAVAKLTVGDDSEAASATMEKSMETPAEQGQGMKQEMVADTAQSEPIRVLGGKSNRVIIRRGDNLWEIARRVYGAGIRYSTIYDSNTEQIRDPHWIYPGQVFQLPEGEEGWDTNFDAVEHPGEEDMSKDAAQN